MPKAILMIAVIALVPIVHDHIRYEPGEPLEVKDTELAQLLEVNAVKLKEEAVEPEAPAAPPAKAPAKK